MSWKKYGGINQFEQMTNLNTNTLVADHLSLRYPYEGTFTICGELIVNNQTFLDNDVTILGNVFGDQNMFISESVNVGNSVDICNNLLVKGNSYVYKPLYLVGANGQGLNTNTGIGNMYFMGDTNGVGLNTTTPNSILDIYGSRSEILNVYSSQIKNRNILARNNRNSGITLSTDSTGSYIDFYHSDLPINSKYDQGIGGGGGTVKYTPDGNLNINVSTNVKVLSKMVVSNRYDELSNLLQNETVAIYDTSYGVYLQDVYNQSNVYQGTSLNLTSSDANAITFLNITNPDKTGWQWGGGPFPNDYNRNMATMGYTDLNNKYVPTETIVSGNSLVVNRSTIGINTFSPETEKYIMNINGPLHIQHNEIHLIQKCQFEIVSMSFSRDVNYPNYGVAVGTSSSIVKNNYIYQFLYTTNGGHTWNVSSIDQAILNQYQLNTATVTFKVFFRDYLNVAISSNLNYTFISNDGGIHWIFKSLTALLTEPSLYISNYSNASGNTVNRLFLCYPNDIYSDSSPAAIYYFDDYIYSTQLTPQYIPFDIYGVDGNDTYMYVVGNGGICVLDITQTPIVPIHYNTNTLYYNAVRTIENYPNIAIAVGTDIISITTNTGNSWNNITNINANLRDIYIWDLQYAIAVGDAGTIYYTKDFYQTWTELTLAEINAMGNGNQIINASKNIVAVKMTNIDQFVFAVVSQEFVDQSQLGSTDMYHLYLPDLFNKSAHSSVLDICGNMAISGDIHVNDLGKIQTNNDSFYLLNETADTVYFAGDANTILMGNSMTEGSTYIRHQLDVSGNVQLHNNLTVDGIEYITNITDATNMTSGSLQVSGGASVQKQIHMGGNMYGYSNFNLTGNQITQGNTWIQKNTTLGSNISNHYLVVNGKSYFNNDVSMANYLQVLGDASFNKNVDVSSNLFVHNNTTIDKNLYVNANSNILGVLSVSNDIIGYNHLFVNNDVSLNRNLFVSNNATVNNNLYIQNDEHIYGNVYISKNNYVSQNEYITGDISINGTCYQYGNTYIGDKSSDLLNVNAQANFFTDVYLNKSATITNNLTVKNDIQIDGSLEVKGSTTKIGKYSTDTLTVDALTILNNETTNMNGSLFIQNDISSNGNIYINNILNKVVSTRLDTVTGNLYIGENANSIFIGSSSGATKINIRGTQEASQTVAVKTIILNTSSQLIPGNPNADGSNTGIQVQEDGNEMAGYVLTSEDRKQFKFKSPASSNVVSLNVGELIPINNNPNGLLVLSPHTNTTSNPYHDNAINYEIHTSSLDISNILQRNAQLSTVEKQVVQTNVAIQGNVIINTSSTNTTAALDVSGQIYHSNGWISQF